jgi:succinoglycan biosynthesis transport protein ExoP
LTLALAPASREGLIEALNEPSRLAALVVKRNRSGLDVLPCPSDARIPNAAELLGSPKMQHLLAAARKTYDYIIVEIAPIVSVVDVKKIERFIDRFIFVVECGQTKRTLVLDALSSAEVVRNRLTAVSHFAASNPLRVRGPTITIRNELAYRQILAVNRKTP